MRSTRSTALLLVMGLGFGCASQRGIEGFRLSAEAQAPDRSFFVMRQPKDERNFDASIAAALRRAGLSADHGTRPDEVAYEVRYIDRWAWDLRMYLIDLRIDVVDAHTKELIATTRSYQTSVAALGETHESVIDRCVDALLIGVEAQLEKEKAERISREALRRRKYHP